jgi:hypothetical protein
VPEIIQTTVRLPEELLQRLKLACLKRKTNQTKAIIEGLALWLAEPPLPMTAESSPTQTPPLGPVQGSQAQVPTNHLHVDEDLVTSLLQIQKRSEAMAAILRDLIRTIALEVTNNAALSLADSVDKANSASQEHSDSLSAARPFMSGPDLGSASNAESSSAGSKTGGMKKRRAR